MSLLHKVNCSSDGGAQFLCQRFGTDDPILAVRKAVAELFSGYPSDVPVDLKWLLAKRRIELQCGEVPFGKEAALCSASGGFRLMISQAFDDPFRQVRARFNIAHELIESFFFAEDTEIPSHWTRLPAYRALASSRVIGPAGYEERLCDYGAGLVLVPTRLIEQLTSDGRQIPRFRELERVAKICGTGTLQLTHRIANYLSVRNGCHAAVVLIRRDAVVSGSAESETKWRLWPSRVKSGHPAGVDIGATLEFGMFLPTNRSLTRMGFNRVNEWLNDGGSVEDAPIGEESCLRFNGRSVLFKVRSASQEAPRGTCVLWWELSQCE